ncbi:MAG: hypothetical protein BWY77_01352 [bacterium ADurb.Bin431]|nr:MAG: hypothetical protein BWY77_01352 [bacterium ADurb.Bin431]
MHIQCDFWHPTPEHLVDGLHSCTLHLDVISVHVQAEFVDPAVMEITPGIGLGHDQEIGLIEHRFELPEGNIAEQGQRRLLGRLLAAVLASGDQDRRLAAVDLFRALGALSGHNAEQQTCGRIVRHGLSPAGLHNLHGFGLVNEGADKVQDLLMLSVAGIGAGLTWREKALGAGRQNECEEQERADQGPLQHEVILSLHRAVPDGWYSVPACWPTHRRRCRVPAEWQCSHPCRARPEDRQCPRENSGWSPRYRRQ